MSRESSAIFLALLMGMAFTGAALIWSIPPLFSPHEPDRVWTTAVLGGLFGALAVGTLYLRPTRPRTSERKADE